MIDHPEALLRRALKALLWSEGQSQGYAYRGPADFVLREGRSFDPHAARLIRGAPRACFGNAIANATAREKEGWHYVEGYALSLVGVPIPIHHAWVTDDAGALIEATWRPQGVAYLGVVFSVERADDCTWNGDASVLDDFKRRWPLLRSRWDGEDEQRRWEHSPRLELIRRKVRGLEVTRSEFEQVLSDD